jgi:hypothetical protein
MHLRCTQVHENALRLWGLCIGIGVGIGIGFDSDSDTDPEVIQTLRLFSKRISGIRFPA